jgi:hypothetical protein
MAQQPRQWSGGEVLIFSLLLMFGGVATVAFPPLLILYALGCVGWLIYWCSTRGGK